MVDRRWNTPRQEEKERGRQAIRDIRARLATLETKYDPKYAEKNVGIIKTR